MLDIRQGKLQNEKETIEALEANGIRVVMKPVALMPDNLERGGIGRPHIATIETDIYEALRMLEIRAKIIGDPFS